jgi:DNA-binding transcriptional ArsR family regulator
MSDARPSRPPQPPVYQAKAEFFRILGHPVRVRTLELLRDGERTVGDLQSALGLDSGGTSQHLGVLRKHGVLESRREGTSVYYRMKDPRMLQLLEIARQILTTNLTESQQLLGQLTDSAPTTARPRSTARDSSPDQPADTSASR